MPKKAEPELKFVNSVPALRDLLKSLEDVIQFDFITALPSDYVRIMSLMYLSAIL